MDMVKFNGFSSTFGEIMNKKMVVVGGGTAGWLTALFVRNIFPNAEMVVVESSKLDILGAGEGSTPNLVEMLKDLGISIYDVIKHTNATFKTGIKFTNWHGDDTSYFHPFHEGEYFLNFDLPLWAFEEIGKGNNLDLFSLNSYCSDQNKLDVYFDHNEGIFKFNVIDAIHFDARKLAEFLRSVAQARNIEVIDTIVEDIVTDADGNITSLKCENNLSIDCDFVFDCSGFKRLIIGKFFNSEWNDYTKKLPVNKALPFFLPAEKDHIPPYTEAIAMKNGWIWKIPLQHRYGCGYVFSDNHTTKEDAKNEIFSLFGDVDIPREFDFDPGFYKKIWIKNCIAFGLSSGFVEPLEATTIMTQIVMLKFFESKCMPGLINNDEKYKELFSNVFSGLMIEIMDFIQLHYLTQRKDSNFWSNFSKENIISDKIIKLLSIKNVFESTNLAVDTFPSFNSHFVLAGTKNYKKEMFEEHFNYFVNLEKFSNYNFLKNEMLTKIKIFSNFRAVDQLKFINHIKEYG